jgi:hypothetical protein
MFTTNIPKFLWGEAVKTATYLINRMPLRILGYKTPAECLFKSNEFIVPPKVFGCVCFVHDYRNSVGKLDPRAIKCVFVGYPPSKRGYRCWCPSERRFFVSMDVTFREHESYYGPASNTGITLAAPEVQQEGGHDDTLNPVLVPSSGGSLIHNNAQSQGEEKEDDSDSCQGDTGDATRTLSQPLQVAESPMHEDPGFDSNSPSSVYLLLALQGRAITNQLIIPLKMSLKIICLLP